MAVAVAVALVINILNSIIKINNFPPTNTLNSIMKLNNFFPTNILNNTYKVNN